MKYNFIIKTTAIIVCAIISIIIFSIWFVLIPIKIILDIIILIGEELTGKEYIHNYIARNFIRNTIFIKEVYNRMIDNDNFIDFNKNED